jgi:hypothetical protein
MHNVLFLIFRTLGETLSGSAGPRLERFWQVFNICCCDAFPQIPDMADEFRGGRRPRPFRKSMTQIYCLECSGEGRKNRSISSKQM